jgi:hypothetical protein
MTKKKTKTRMFSIGTKQKKIKLIVPALPVYMNLLSQQLLS